jgi:hypothetical protein
MNIPRDKGIKHEEAEREGVQKIHSCIFNHTTMYRENGPGTKTGRLKFQYRWWKHWVWDLTVGKVICKFLPFTTLGGTMGISDIHLFGTRMKHQTGKWFTTDANMKKVSSPFYRLLLWYRAWSVCPGCTTALRLIVQPTYSYFRRSHFRYQAPPRPPRRKTP